MTTNRPYAAFDIDGTLIRWQLYHAVADELARSGHLDPVQFQKVREARMAWKHRSGDATFKAYEQTLVNLVDVAIRGINVDDLMAACHSVVAEYKDQVYTYTRDLIKELRGKNYLLFVVSASQSEIVELLAEYYGFDDFAGSRYGVKDGYFTGEKDILVSERKPIVLRELIAKHGAVQEESIAVGDSESDIPMLSSVQNPIVFNPTKLLFDHATAQGWPIVVERKNVIYELNSSSNGYSLST